MLTGVRVWAFYLHPKASDGWSFTTERRHASLLFVVAWIPSGRKLPFSKTAFLEGSQVLHSLHCPLLRFPRDQGYGKSNGNLMYSPARSFHPSIYPPQDRVNAWMATSGTPAVPHPRGGGSPRRISYFWKMVAHYEWGLHCRCLESRVGRAALSYSVTAANLNSAGGTVSVDIAQSRGVGKGENPARPILLRHDASE